LLQQTLLRASATGRTRNQVCRAFRALSASDSAHQRLERTIERLHFLSKGLDNRYDALLDDGIQSEIKAWLEGLSALRMEVLRRLLTRMQGGEVLAPEKLAAWSLATRGYSS
jgi:hypothetical protein